MEKFTIIVIKNDKELIHYENYRNCTIIQNRKVTPQYLVGNLEPLPLVIEPGSETLEIRAEIKVRGV